MAEEPESIRASGPRGGERQRLWPLIASQFSGAFNDNAWKMIVLVLGERALRAHDSSAEAFERAKHGQTTWALIALTLPLLVFALPAGALADRVGKRTVLVGAKLLELALLVTAALLLRSGYGFEALVLLLAGMGLQSAIYGPAKYGIIPELVPHARLSAANGTIELWTFLAIVGGTAVGPLLLRGVAAPWQAAAALGLLSLVGLALTFLIPPRPPARSEGGVVRTVSIAWRALRADRALRLAAVGAAWFWALASLLGENLLVYSSTHLHLDESRTGYPLGAFGVGVGLGSALAGRMSARKVELGLVPLGALGLCASTLLLGATAPGFTGTIVLLILLGIASGVLLVPLQALIQWRAPADGRGAVISFANAMQYLGMLLGPLAAGLLARTAFSVRTQFVVAGLITAAGLAWSLWLLPEALVRTLALLLSHSIYRLRVIGADLLPASGGVLIAPNHVSFVDGLFLLASVDRPIRFIVDEGQFERPFFRPVLRALGAIPIRGTGGPRSVLRALRDAGHCLDEGEVVCIFPEGQITRTGALQPFRRGLERIARGRAAVIVPAYLDRLWGSVFSFERGRFVRKLPRRIPYPVTLAFGEPLPADTDLRVVRRAVEGLGERAWGLRKNACKPLHRSFVSRARLGPWRPCATDAVAGGVTRIGLLARSIAMARRLREDFARAEHVGVLLPPSVAGAAANVAALLAGRVPVNLNFTVGPAGLTSAARQAGLRVVLTSRVFLEKAGVELPAGVDARFLEDVASGIGGTQRVIAALLAFAAPARLIERACGSPKAPVADDVATVIFSSGSTGEPKGVMLTHFNIDSNVHALGQVFRPETRDRLLGSLPLFHSFGMLSLWFALHHGVPVIFQPNPLDAEAVGALVERHRITLLLATPTFLQIYLRRVPPDQFGSLRVVLAGAEKLQERLANAFEERFGVRPLEGYGATECAPVVAASVPPFRAPGFFQPGSRRGSVGRPLPGVIARIVDPETREELEPGAQGLLLVRGPNVMKGYLGRPDLTADALCDGEYVTGDLAVEDEDGFLFITDRMSRFSKIGGEMVPHGRVEEALQEAYGREGGPYFVVTGVPDEKKGERLAVVTTLAESEIPPLLEALGGLGLPNLFIPRKDAFVRVAAIPLLGTGKIDLKGVKVLAQGAD